MQFVSIWDKLIIILHNFVILEYNNLGLKFLKLGLDNEIFFTNFDKDLSHDRTHGALGAGFALPWVRKHGQHRIGAEN